MRAFISVVLVLVPPLLFGLFGKPTEMGIAMVAGALAASFLNLDRIQRFRGAGFEAEMKRAVEEAYATTDAVRQVARPLILAAIRVLTMSNRFGGVTPIERQSIHSDLERAAAELEIGGDSALIEASDAFHQYITWDHFAHFARMFSGPEQSDMVINQRLQQLVPMRYSSSDFPSREAVRAAIGEYWEHLTEGQSQAFQDYEYYRDHRELRREGVLGRSVG